MDPLVVVGRLASIGGRSAASDAERRTATWLRDSLRTDGRPAALETAWVHPHWQLAHALHGLLAIAGSITSIWEPEVGVALLAIALASLVGDLSGRLFLLRRLTPERATQTVVSPPLERPDGGADDDRRVRMIVTANIDAGRTGSIYDDRWTRLEARAGRLLRGHLASPLALLAAAIAALCAIAAVRAAGTEPGALSAIQFALTVLVILAVAALLDIALSDASAGANANASGVAVALALVQALDAAPLRQVDVALVLAGAGDSQALGLRSFVKARRRVWRASDVAIVSIEPCGGGTPQWLERDGRLLGMRLHPRLRALMAATAEAERQLMARGRRSHGHSGAFAARVAGWPAIAVGAFAPDGRVPRAHQQADTLEAIDPAALEATLELCLAFAGRLDAELRSQR